MCLLPEIHICGFSGWINCSQLRLSMHCNSLHLDMAALFENETLNCEKKSQRIISTDEIKRFKSWKRFKRIIAIMKAEEAEISWLLGPKKGQAPDMLDPTVPLMQPESI